MLDRAQLACKLDAIADSLFIDTSHELSIVRRVWDELVRDPAAQYKAHACSSALLVPTWHEDLATVHEVAVPDPYHVVGIDGSQIYPDRHQGVACYLINVGTAAINYQSIRVDFTNQPYVYSGNNEQFELSTDLVNAQRQEHELIAASEHIRTMESDKPLCMMDGSLIFWHIASKDTVMRDYFLERYMIILDQLYRDQVLYMGYISLPRSKELVNLVRLHLSEYDVSRVHECDAVDHVVDASIMKYVLREQTRSIVFQNNSPVTSLYPEHAHPHFFYLHTGDEIARVEIPAWIAADSHKVNDVASCALDQSIKGGGYPVVLAEAHEQAVVKGPDREFFYHLIQRLSYTYKRSIFSSQKSVKKRGIGI